MKPKAEDIINLTSQMRQLQKEFFKTRNGLALRKAKDLERQLDTMLAAWYGNEQQEKENQLNLF